jgi:NADPH:quinone reductase-like Zn-dependent oxidoreductase
MQVAEVSAFGGPEVLRLAERPDPAPAPGEVVVRIHAAGGLRGKVVLAP